MRPGSRYRGEDEVITVPGKLYKPLQLWKMFLMVVVGGIIMIGMVVYAQNYGDRHTWQFGVVILLGALLGLVFWRDVKRLQERDEALRLAKQELEEAHHAKDQLMHADRLASLGTLVSGAAHEINNPTNLISLSNPTLRDAWKSIVPILDRHYEEEGDFPVAGLPYSEMKDLIPSLFDGIDEGTSRIAQIVKDLRDFGGADDLGVPQAVDINEIAASAVRLTRNRIARTAREFSEHYYDNLPHITGNPRRVEQVIVGLLQNACDALDARDGGGSMGISTSTTDDNTTVIVEICDQGIGMTTEQLSRAMDPFYTTKRDSGGTGLGLSVSLGIIRDHRGELALESESGKGTTVRITIPAETQASGSENV